MATYNGTTRAKSSSNERCFIVTGGSASASLTCTGIKTNSVIKWIFHESTAAAIATRVLLDLDTVTITAADTITCTTDTSSDQLEVYWIDVDA